MSKIRITSTGPLASDVHVYLDGKDVTGKILPTAIILEGGTMNTAWLKVEGVELDLEVDESACNPLVHSGLRELRAMADEIITRLADLEAEVRRERLEDMERGLSL